MSKDISSLVFFFELQKEILSFKEKVFFIAGTDTDIGKTYVSTILSHLLNRKYKKIAYIKPVGAGETECESDEFFLKKYGPLGMELKTIYSLRFPASPHLAAEKQNIAIEEEFLIGKIKDFLKQKKVALVEGAGGLMVPLSTKFMIIDLIQNLKLPTILVGRAGLGTINHTLLSVEALKKRKVSISLIILNNCEDLLPDEIVLENVRIIEKLTGIRTLLLPYFSEIKELRNFSPTVS